MPLFPAIPSHRACSQTAWCLGRWEVWKQKAPELSPNLSSPIWTSDCLLSEPETLDIFARSVSNQAALTRLGWEGKGVAVSCICQSWKSVTFGCGGGNWAVARYIKKQTLCKDILKTRTSNQRISICIQKMCLIHGSWITPRSQSCHPAFQRQH